MQLAQLPLPAFVADAAGRVCEWNPALQRWTGRSAAGLADVRVADLLGRDLVWAPADGGVEPLEVDVTGPDGRPARAQAFPSGLDGDQLGRTLVVLVAALGPSTPRSSAAELRAPRIVQWSELTDRVRTLGESGVCATFGVVGLDAVNASYSRSTGDLVLTEIASRLAEFAPPGAVVERTGGERFVVVVPEDAVPEGGWADLVVRLRAPVDTPLGRVAVGSSVGIATGDPRSALVLLDASERRLDSALLRGAGIVEEQRSAVRAPALSARHSGELVEAVARGGVRAHYQPVVDVRSMQIVELEALARWDSDDARREAAEFISAAADTGVIVPMGAGVLSDAVELARTVASTVDHQPFAVSVNVSLRELLDVDFLGIVDEHLRRSGIRPSNLQVELGAAVPTDEIDDVAARIASLRSLGVRVALDNVAGHTSSVLVVRDLAVDVVKLDPSLVAGLGVNERAEHLLRSLLDLGRHLGVTVVAKGVERAEQHELLRALGCRYAQGYLYGSATPALELPFDQLVGHSTDRRAVTAREELVAELVGHGAFDHLVLDDLVTAAAEAAGTGRAAVMVADTEQRWFASVVGEAPSDAGVADGGARCAEVIASGCEIVIDGAVTLPVCLGGEVVAVLCADVDDVADLETLDRLRAVAAGIGTRLESRARLAGAELRCVRPAAADGVLVG